MAIKLHIAQLSEESIGFGYSVLKELLLSLNVLNNHKNHPLHISWALATRRRLSAEVRAELRVLRPVVSTASTFLVGSDNVEEPDFELEFTKFEMLSAEQFAEVLINDYLLDAPPSGQRILKRQASLSQFTQSAALQQKVTSYLSMWYGESDELLAQLTDKPLLLQQRFLNLIQQYWNSFFQDEWHRIEPIVLKEIEACGRHLLRDGIVPMLAHLSERFSVDAAGQTVSFFKPNVNEECSFRPIDRLNVYPSYFTYPSILFSIHQESAIEPLTFSITYSTLQQRLAGQPPVPPEQMLEILRAVADGTRLQILELVAQKPRSTGELAQIIGVSDAAISKQLKQMQRTGWVEARRESYYVLYRETDTPLQQLTNGLAALLHSSSPS